jgi:hypothetical protein
LRRLGRAGGAHQPCDVETRYRSALAAYVENVDEESQLMAALALGRKLLAEGQGLRRNLRTSS